MAAEAPTKIEKLESALHHLKSALHLLDESNAPSHVGAHIDLATVQLEDVIFRTMGAQIIATNAPAKPTIVESLS